jgi:hypothetical protein
LAGSLTIKRSLSLEQKRDKEIKDLQEKKLQLEQDIADREGQIIERRLRLIDEAAKREQDIRDGLYEAQQEYQRNEIEAERKHLDALARSVSNRAFVLAERTRLDLDEEDAATRNAQLELTRREGELKAEATTEAQKLEIEKNYNALREQEEQRHQDARAEILRAAERESRGNMFGSLNPFGNAGMTEFVDSGDVMKGVFADLKETGLDAFNSLATGFGSLVQQWASGANLGAHAMQKLISSVLAGVAAQAATQALLFTAYGIAALTPWGAAIYGPAAQWFEAAAIMASIGAVAAVAARAIAPAQSSPAVAGNAVSGGKAASSSPQPVVAGRTTANNTISTQVIELHIKSNDSHIVETFVRDWMGNGKVRTIVKGDGVLAA